MHVGLFDRNFVEQCFLGHAVIAFRMIRRDAAFIAPIDLHFGPIEGPLRRGVFAAGKQLEHQFRRAAAGECDGKGTFFRDGVHGGIDEKPQGCMGDGWGILND